MCAREDMLHFLSRPPQMPNIFEKKPRCALQQNRPPIGSYWSMLLKKVFLGVERIFSEAPVRWSENDVVGHIISPISNRRPS
jgi:hypothetical protein